MSTSLYELSVASYLQSVASVGAIMEKGRTYASENGIALDDFVQARLTDDMLPFRFQILSVVHQSMGVVEGIQTGQFSPPKSIEPLDYDELAALLQNTLQSLQAVDTQALNDFAGKPVIFKMGELQIPFTAENFVLSFSLPNLYFHATTAYDILRQKGVPLSKRDFLGQMRTAA